MFFKRGNSCGLNRLIGERLTRRAGTSQRWAGYRLLIVVANQRSNELLTIQSAWLAAQR